MGAIYNGQIVKALIHVLIFAGLCWAQERSGGNVFFGLMIAFFFFYMVWDAHATAKAIQERRPLPDPFGLGANLPASETTAPAQSRTGERTRPTRARTCRRPQSCSSG